MPKQSRKRPTRKARLIEFPQARGKTVETVELNLDSDFSCISIRFEDNTDLTVVVNPWLTFRADYHTWADGEQKVLKRWHVLRSDGM